VLVLASVHHTIVVDVKRFLDVVVVEERPGAKRPRVHRRDFEPGEGTRAPLREARVDVGRRANRHRDPGREPTLEP